MQLVFSEVAKLEVGTLQLKVNLLHMFSISTMPMKRKCRY